MEAGKVHLERNHILLLRSAAGVPTSGKFQRFNAIGGSIEILKNS